MPEPDTVVADTAAAHGRLARLCEAGVFQDRVDGRLYTREFFEIFVAVMLFMTGVALQFHFGQYVQYLGYDVDTLGWVLSASMVGTLAIRLHIGRWIDRFGCRPMWLVGTVVVALSVGSIQFAERLWVITTLRAACQMAVAAVMTTVAVLAAQIAPPYRRAESLGTIGLGGFLGMIIGPSLGDWIFSGSADTMTPYRIFFSASAVFSLLAGGVAMLTVADRPPKTEPGVSSGEEGSGPTAPKAGPKTPAAPMTSQIKLVFDYWPGIVLLIATVFGAVFCLQSLYLERLAESRGFKNIKVFFLVYAPTAMTLRVVFRHLPGQIGRSRTLVGGLLLQAAGLLCLRGIESQGQLILPGLLMGAGHCFVFPSMVDLAAAEFPFSYRGTGTAVILGAADLGMLLGYVGLGEVIGALGFDAAILTLSITVMSGAVIFALARRRTVFGTLSYSERV